MSTNRVAGLIDVWNEYKDNPTPEQAKILADNFGYMLSQVSKLTFNSYQEEALRTRAFRRQNAIDYCSAKLSVEAGEVLEVLIERHRDEDDGRLTEVRIEKAIEEIGDCLWYAAVLAYELGVPFEEVARRNFIKLSERANKGNIKKKGLKHEGK